MTNSHRNRRVRAGWLQALPPLVVVLSCGATTSDLARFYHRDDTSAAINLRLSVTPLRAEAFIDECDSSGVVDLGRWVTQGSAVVLIDMPGSPQLQLLDGGAALVTVGPSLFPAASGALVESWSSGAVCPRCAALASDAGSGLDACSAPRGFDGG